MTDLESSTEQTTPPQYLSKSRLLYFHQCPLRLWNEVYRREAAKPTSELAQYRFDTGTAIGVLARNLVEKGRLVEAEYWDHAKALRETSECLDNPSVPALFEAAFEYRRTRVRCDLLVRAGKTWELWEVKSVLNVKEQHLLDIAIQAHVMRESRLGDSACELTDMGIMHLNAAYMYDGIEYDLSSLFSKCSCRETAAGMDEEVEALIDSGLSVIDCLEPPTVKPGDQCSDPYECPFSGTICEVPKSHPLAILPGIGPARIKKLEERGICTLSEYTANHLVNTPSQKRVVEAIESGNCIVNQGLVTSLTAIGYPRYYLDFETFMPTLPRYIGTSPLQSLPFQFSVHIEEAADRPAEHVGYLHNADTDPRRPLAEALLAVFERHPNSPVLMYSGYEKRVLNELAQALPDLRVRLKSVTTRLLDLCAIVKNNVYHPAFNGSFSIKDVLPALVPELGYTDLEIADGNTASLRYIQMLYLLKSDQEAANDIWQKLWAYCERDTEAMVAVHQALVKLATQ